MTFIHKNAIKIFLVLLVTVILFHFCIIFKIIPYKIAWGGQLQNDIEMYVFETISISVNAFLSWVLLMKGNYVSYRFLPKVINIILWIFFAVFVLNTIGNMFAKTTFEKFFTILTALSAFLIWKIIKQSDDQN
jgi:hypothetical protein